MQIRFDGHIVAVSGAGHGFRRCIAETFADLGARVFGCDLSADELAETAKAGVATAVVDLIDRVAASAWIAGIEGASGSAIDVLVNNAGGVAGQEARPLEAVPDAEWDRIALKRPGTPQDIANAVVFFASSLAGFINGQILQVDGGN